jgi:hypothetical protein
MSAVAIHICGGTYSGNKLCTSEVANSYQPCPNLIESWTGCVIYTGEHNWHDDSDFYALVWDEQSQSVREIEYASTRGWTYHNGAKVDADADTMAKAQEYLARQRAAADVKLARIKSSEPAIGKEVRSLTTRGKNAGVVGIIRSIEASKYRHGAKVAVVEVAGENQRRYIDLDRVQVINPDQYLIS